MRHIFTVLALLCLLGAICADDTWHSYKKKFGKSYSAAEEVTRKGHYEKTNARIKQHNEKFKKGLVTYKMGHNKLSDKDHREKRNHHLGLRRVKNFVKKSKLAPTASYRLTRALPATYDLRTSNCMPAVKNQGGCGCCWAFATTTPIEYQLCKKSNRSRTLSEQQLVDCVYGSFADGCQGGDHHDAWTYIFKAGGQVSSTVYGYSSGRKGASGSCRFNKNNAIAKLANAGNDLPQNETAMQMALVAKGPLTIAYYVSDNFYNYVSGVFSDPTCLTDYYSLNHEMVIVGYGVRNGVPYWIVRNQWGTGWGQNGYVFIKRGTKECGIAVEAGYPTVA